MDAEHKIDDSGVVKGDVGAGNSTDDGTEGTTNKNAGLLFRVDEIPPIPIIITYAFQVKFAECPLVEADIIIYKQCVINLPLDEPSFSALKPLYQCKPISACYPFQASGIALTAATLNNLELTGQHAFELKS